MAVSFDQSNMFQGASTQYGRCQTQMRSSTKLTKKNNRKIPILHHLLPLLNGQRNR